jgi:hypothetical protein
MALYIWRALQLAQQGGVESQKLSCRREQGRTLFVLMHEAKECVRAKKSPNCVRLEASEKVALAFCTLHDWQNDVFGLWAWNNDATADRSFFYIILLWCHSFLISHHAILQKSATIMDTKVGNNFSGIAWENLFISHLYCFWYKQGENTYSFKNSQKITNQHKLKTE